MKPRQKISNTILNKKNKINNYKNKYKKYNLIISRKFKNRKNNLI